MTDVQKECNEREKMNSTKIIEQLMKACESLMSEVSQTGATDWGIVSDAMIEGQKYLKERKNQ